MFNAFKRNLNNFFIINKGADDYRMKIAEVLKGLSDISLYEKWKNEDIHRYKEINNLVYQINLNINKYQLFETFARDLWGYGYDAIKDSSFNMDDIEEQLKLINLCLKGQFI